MWIKHLILLAHVPKVDVESFDSERNPYTLDEYFAKYSLRQKYQEVYSAVQKQQELPEELTSIFRYMMQYAALHVRWYAHELSDEQFYIEMAAARLIRADGFNAVQGGMDAMEITR